MITKNYSIFFFFLAIISFVNSGFGLTSKNANISKIERPPAHPFSLEEQVIYWRSEAMKCVTPSGIEFPTKQSGKPQPCEDGDMTIFNGLLCAAENQLGCEGVRKAQDLTTGEWFRSPRIQERPEDPSTGRRYEGKAEFSPDMAMGVQLYLLKTLDVQAAELWFGWLHGLTCSKNNPTLKQTCSGTPTFCEHPNCGIRPSDAATLWLTANYLQTNHGMKSIPEGTLKTLMEREGPRFSTHMIAQATVNEPGYSQHLVAAQILLSNMIGYSNSNITEAAKRLAVNPVNKYNAFFSYLVEGDTPRVRSMISEECPHPNSSLDYPLKEWTWEREAEDNAWKKSCMWDCLFTYELLDKNLSTPGNLPPGECLIDDAIVDDRKPFISSSNSLFSAPFNLRDLQPKTNFKININPKISLHNRKYIDASLAKKITFPAHHDRGIRVLPHKDPHRWKATLTNQCSPPAALCFDNSKYTSAFDTDENGFHSLNGQIYKLDNGVPSLLDTSPYIDDFFTLDFYDYNNERHPLLLGQNETNKTMVTSFINKYWHSKVFDKCQKGIQANLFSLENRVIFSCIQKGYTSFHTTSNMKTWSQKTKSLRKGEMIWPYIRVYRPRADDKTTNSDEVFIMTTHFKDSGPLIREYFLLSNKLELKQVLAFEKEQLQSVIWIDRDHLLYSTTEQLVSANIETGTKRIVANLKKGGGCSDLLKILDSNTIYAMCSASKSLPPLKASLSMTKSSVSYILKSDNAGQNWTDVTSEVGLW